MTRDREEADTYRLTQDALALTLGVRRVGITVAAQTLQRFQPDTIDNRDVASAVSGVGTACNLVVPEPISLRLDHGFPWFVEPVCAQTQLIAA